MAKQPEPTVVQFRDVTAAAYRIKKCVKETPLEVCVSSNVGPASVQSALQESPQLSEHLGMKIFFKKEFRMPTGRYMQWGGGGAHGNTRTWQLPSRPVQLMSRHMIQHGSHNSWLAGRTIRLA